MERKVVTGDLLDENFTHLEAYISHERKISGWDMDLGEGGSFDYAFGEWFKLIDRGIGSGIRMRKGFVRQNKDKITLEYRFRMPVKMDWVVWELKGGEATAIRVYTYKNHLWYGDGRQMNIKLSAYEDNLEYGIKVEANIDDNTADIYVNGILKAKTAAFINPSSFLDHILIMTSGKDSGEIFLNPVNIYKGYIIREKFLSCTPGNIPSDWKADNTGGTGSSQEFRCSAAPDFYSYRMENTVAGRSVSIFKEFSPVKGKVILEYRFLLPSEIDGMGVSLSGEGNNVINIFTKDGHLCFSCMDGETQAIQPYIQNLWYHVRLEIDLDIGIIGIHANGKKKYCGTLNIKGVELDSLKIHTSDEGRGILWVDDILFYNAVPEPEDYVPVPVPANGGPYYLGMQVCSLWREGHHNGWDFIRPYPERKPYLGWYEEGSPEVSDWEIKWMVEHGVVFQLYCWYRPGAGLGNPIKNPLSEYNLHDGYFYAKYSHLLKFAIMFENGNTKCDGFYDLLNNLIPFWLEYYIKDPRYMCIDNKPIFGIYSVDGLIRDFGGMDGAKKAVESIRQAIAGAGFNGTVMLCECREKDTELMGKIKEAGFDCIYSYTWYTGDKQIQKEKMLWQKNTGIMDLLPTISMGWHTEACGGTDASWASPEDFEELSYWVKNEYMHMMDKNSMGRRLIMLDNWNEFGEGHFMMPAGLHGFGYLDVLRKVFTDFPEHTDETPTERQLARMDTLYTKGW